MDKNLRRTTIRNRKRKYIYDYLSNNPCEHCGESRPVCLEFHHQWDKEICLSEAKDWSIPRIQMEIEKCQVLCSNCHKVVTAKEQWRYSYLNLPEFNERIDWPMMSS